MITGILSHAHTRAHTHTQTSENTNKQIHGWWRHVHSHPEAALLTDTPATHLHLIAVSFSAQNFPEWEVCCEIPNQYCTSRRDVDKQSVRKNPPSIHANMGQQKNVSNVPCHNISPNLTVCSKIRAYTPQNSGYNYQVYSCISFQERRGGVSITKCNKVQKGTETYHLAFGNETWLTFERSVGFRSLRKK